MNDRDMSTIQTITPRQLRKILFYLDNQDATVEQLRKQLFDNDNQDIPVSVDHALSARLKVSTTQ